MNLEGKNINEPTYDLIKAVEKENNVEISPIQKILLSLRGPITTPLDALYGRSKLFVLKQEIEKADESVADLLDINEGDEVLIREVIVHKNGRPLVYAYSHIPTERCNDKILKLLLDEEITTGLILSENNIETQRQINDISIESPTPILQELFNTTEDMLTREYSMSQHGTIRLYTKEAYPLSYFREM